MGLGRDEPGHAFLHPLGERTVLHRHHWQSHCLRFHSGKAEGFVVCAGIEYGGGGGVAGGQCGAVKAREKRTLAASKVAGA